MRYLCCAERREYQPTRGMYARLLQPIVRGREVGRHAGRAFLAAAEWDAVQVAIRGVAPLVIDTIMRLGVPAIGTTHFRAAMRATINPGGKAAVRTTCHDDGRVTDEGPLEVVRVRDFGFQAEKVQYRAAKNPLLPPV